MEKREVLISWLSEFDYCPRRFWLKAVEKNVGDNLYTAEGSEMHERVHSCKIEKRRSVITVTGLDVSSVQYNLYGICDCVEFITSKEGSYIPFLNERCIICPVEYKHGKVRNEREYKVQLVAQTLCLEEMYNTSIAKGFIYYTNARHRQEVEIGEDIRCYTKSVIQRLTDFIADEKPPSPNYLKRCRRCSVYDVCSPKNVMVGKYMKELWENV